MGDVTPIDWIKLRARYPKQFHKLIDLGFQMERIFSSIDRAGLSIITERRLREMTDLSQRILFEYKRLLADKHEEIKKDMQKEYSLVFHGEKESFLSQYIRADPAKKRDYLQAYILQLQAMIHFRIYDTLIVAHRQIYPQIKTEFVKQAVAKTGVFEKLNEEEEEF